MSKAKRRAQANNRGSYATGLTAQQWATLVVLALQPHQIARWQQRRIRAAEAAAKPEGSEA